MNNVGNLLNRSTVEKINKEGMYPKMEIEDIEAEIRENAKKLMEMVEESRGTAEITVEKFKKKLKILIFKLPQIRP